MTSSSPEASLDPKPSFLDAAKRICIEWEKLRILYNGALVSWVVYVIEKSNPALFQTFEFWAVCLTGAIMANICFLAGPVVEAYFHWIGLRHWTLRWTLMIVGTSLTGFLAAGVLFGLI